MPDLLLELFSEEIPARMQPRAAEDLRRLVTDGLVEAGLTYAGAAGFATPRRLVLTATGLSAGTAPRKEERRGPRTDAPEKAVDGFLRSTGLTRDALEVRADKKGDVYFAAIEHPGRAAAEIVAEVVEKTVRGFPWPKSMRWGAGSLRWVRPLQRILLTLTDEAGTAVVPLEIDGIASDDVTEGHRFHAPGPVAVAGFEDYAAKLEAHRVILDPAERARRIEADAANLAFAQGMEVVPDRGLLAEVAGLVEWPVVLMGEIEERFLDLPPEVLRTSMKEHQKFFSVRRPATGRIERFITVANIEAPDGGATILAGNKRVLAARLADGLFFWENDLRMVEGQGEDGIVAMAKPLETVVFHAKLGTQAARVRRIEALAREIAPAVGADPELAAQAARVAKADLASEMIYEFPELQGVMGRYYARSAGLPEAVAEAAEAHYRPLGPGDEAPDEPVSVAVALADKLDTLTGFWAIGEKPTGSGDPFALRRAALGAIRILLERQLRIGLTATIERAGSFYAEAESRLPGPPARDYVHELVGFSVDRLKVALRDKGVRHDAIDACFRLDEQDDLVLLTQRVEALQTFLGTEDGANLLAGHKRASNILAAEEKKDGQGAFDASPDPALAQEPAETALFQALGAAEPAIAAAVAAEDFAGAMVQMATLRAPVDAFFEAVLVNDPDPAIRANRLRLLSQIRAAMGQVAAWDAIEG
ncbi:MAG: glycine--tRNA ligase subunit beta [Pseudomonadota bacterium]